MKRESPFTLQKTFWLIVSVAIAIGIGRANYLLSFELAFSIFYLFPILLAARKVGTQAGILVSWICVMDWLWTELFYLGEELQILVEMFYSRLSND